MKLERSKEWWLARARSEGDSTVAAGMEATMDLTAFENMRSEVGLWRCRSCHRMLGDHHSTTCNLLRPMTDEDIVLRSDVIRVNHWGMDPESRICRDGCPACAATAEAIRKAEGR